jgi:phosphoglycerate-specific signal transduction histidine kinase
MKDETDRLLYEKGLAFFGRMTSCVSHEMKNILGIVGELGGLLEDLVTAAQQGKAIPHERLRRIADGINKAVQRGDDHLKRLHRFSRQMDAFQLTRSLNETAAEVVALCQRPASLKKAHLRAEFPDGVVAVTAKAFVWQHALYECIGIALEGAQPDDVVTIRLEMQGTAPRIKVASSRGLIRKTVESRMPLLNALAGELEGTIETSGDGESIEALTIAVSS